MLKTREGNRPKGLAIEHFMAIGITSASLVALACLFKRTPNPRPKLWSDTNYSAGTYVPGVVADDSTMSPISRREICAILSGIPTLAQVTNCKVTSFRLQHLRV